MANTIRTYTGDGVTTLFPIDFTLGYLRKDNVYVYTEDYNTQLEYTWVNSSQIELTNPVAAGTDFHIRRIAPRHKLINNYEDGSILREKNLDASHLQHLMLMEEIEDGFLSVSEAFTIMTDLVVKGNTTIEGTTSLEGDTTASKLSITDVLDMLTNRITNLGEPVDNQDAATKFYVDKFLAALANIQAVIPLTQRYIADGVLKVYEVPDSDFAVAESSYIVYLDGVRQAPNHDYTYSNGTITLDEVPAQGVFVDITFFEPSVIGDKINITIAGEGVTPISLDRQVGDGTTTSYTVPPTYKTVGAESYLVYLDGVKQRPTTDYTIQGSQLTFTEAPANGVNIDITFYEPQITGDNDWGSVASATTQPDDDFGTL